MNRRLRQLFDSWKQDEDSRNAFLLIAGISLVVVIALGFAIFGYIDSRKGTDDSVVRVGNEEVSYDYLQKRLSRFMPANVTVTPEQFSSLLSGVMTELEQEVLLEHVARTEGIEITDEEIDAEMRNDLNVPDDATKENFAARLRQELLNSGLSLEQYERMQRIQAIESRIRETAREAIPAEAEQVNIRLIQVGTQGEAAAAKDRINNGEVMGLVAGAVSTHPSRSRGGEVNWVVRGTFDPKLEDAMFSQEVGTISDIIETDDAFYIVEVREKAVRPVDDSVRNAAASYTFNQKVNAAREELGSEITMTTGQLNRLTNHFRSSFNAGG